VKLRRDLSLFWRLIISYLLVILTGGLTVLVVSEAFAPFLLERHVHSMPMMTNPAMQPMLTPMLGDLDAAYGLAFGRSLFWGIALSLLVAGAMALFVTSQIVTPLKRMQRASGRIAAGQYRERLDPQAPGEIGDLAAAFNAMAAALETSEARRVELIRNVAHEFRTPLSSLHGYLEGLEDGLFDADAETLDAFKRQVTRLERLVDDLSLLSRVETGEEPVRTETLEVAKLLEPTVAGLRPQYTAKGVELVLEPIEKSLRVIADPERCAQVVSNLLANALRHTPAGGEVRVAASLCKSGEVGIHVRDSGEGIPEEALPHIFTRFYRADRSRRREKSSGSGIGLTIAKHFVEAQGGHIGVESTPGQGSHFWFTLPSGS